MRKRIQFNILSIPQYIFNILTSLGLSCSSFAESVAVCGCESGDKERHTKGVGDSSERDKNLKRAHGTSSHQPGCHA